MDIKQNIIDRLQSLKGLSPECDEFIEDVALAIDLTDDELVEEYHSATPGDCLKNCLLYNTYITQKYSESFIERASCILFSASYIFVA